MIDKDLSRAFARFDVQASTYIGKRTPSIAPNTAPDSPDIFLNLKGAEDSLFRDLNDVWRFCYQYAITCRYINQQSMPSAVLAEFEAIKQRLCNWKRAFLSFERIFQAWFSKRDVEHASLLHIHHSTGTVLLVGEMNPYETVYDMFDDTFRSIVSLAGQLLRDRLLSPWAGTFAMEMGIVQPLYIAALKCRVHEIRAEAIRLLESVPSPEGIWNGQVMAKIAEQVRLIEEADVNMAYLSSERLPELRRIHSVSSDINQKARTAKFYTLRPGTGSDEWEERSGTVTW